MGSDTETSGDQPEAPPPEEPPSENALPEAIALIESLEGQGWQKKVRRSGKVRYWCPGPCRHQIWVELRPRGSNYFAKTRWHLSHATCWDEELP